MSGTQNVNIIDRRRLEINGVRDVKSFNDTELILLLREESSDRKEDTVYIGGSDLKVERFNVDNGELVLTGIISSLFFQDEPVSEPKRGILSRVFG